MQQIVKNTESCNTKELKQERWRKLCSGFLSAASMTEHGEQDILLEYRSKMERIT